MNTEQLNLEFRPSGKNGHAKVILRQDGKPIFCDTVNLSSAKARDCFLEKVCERFPGLAPTRETLEDRLLQWAAEQDQAHAPGVAEPQGQPVELKWPEPWPEAVSLPEVLAELKHRLMRHVWLTTDQATAITLWVAFTWCYNEAATCPILLVCSPTPRCGKTVLLTLLAEVCCRPVSCSNITGSAVYRLLEEYGPLTLLADEFDAYGQENEDLRCVFNAGHTRSQAYVIRTVPVGDRFEIRRFSCWGPKAVGMIGEPNRTIVDRAIKITMTRKPSSEGVERLDRPAREALAVIARKLMALSQDGTLTTALSRAAIAVPRALNDRAADNWRPLLAIAEAAGGEWPALAHRAAVAISCDTEPADIRELFARDVLSIVADYGECQEIRAKEIAELLANMEDSPWPSYRRGVAISPEQVGRLLRSFGVTCTRVKRGSTYAVGTIREKLLPYTPETTATTATVDVSDELNATYGVAVSQNPTATPETYCNHVSDELNATYDDGCSSGSRKGGLKHNLVNPTPNHPQDNLFDVSPISGNDASPTGVPTDGSDDDGEWLEITL